MALIRTNNAVLSMKIITDLINGFLDTLNVGKTMDAAQVLECAKMILEDYAVLKPDDFVLFFNKAKRGYYGKAYDRMDAHVIFEWLEQYLYDRTSEFESHRRNEHIQREKALASTTETIGLPDYFKPLMEKKVISDEPFKERQPTKQELIVKQFIADFDKESKVIGAKKFLTRVGKKLDIGEWLNYRIQGIS